MTEARLTTLVGPGGAGKSRLAVETASGMMDEYPDGVWLVELVAAKSDAGIRSAIAASLRITELPESRAAEVLERHLGLTSCLVILDNCEHIVDAVADVVVALLEKCAGVTFMATSREPLGVSGETLWPVLGLDVPEAADRRWTRSTTPESVALFEERGRAVAPEFRVHARNADAVAAICRRLDGLPLALELAAARLHALDPTDIKRKLDSPRFLTSTGRGGDPRHRSLHDVLSWSYELLPAHEQVVFARLGVFSGGFDLEMGKGIAGYDMAKDDFDSIVESLVSRSLVTRMFDEGPRTRFRLLETLHTFARDLLRGASELGPLRARHAGAYADLCDEAEPFLWSADQSAWLDRLQVEHDNIRTAVTWYIEAGDPAGAQRIAGSVARFWDLRGFYAEGRDWLQRACALEGPVEGAIALRAFNGLGTLAVLNGDFDLAVWACERAIELARTQGDVGGYAYALQYLGMSQIFMGDVDPAEATLHDAEVAAETSENAVLIGFADVFMCLVDMERGRIESVRTRAARARELLSSAGESEGVGWALIAEGIAHWSTGALLDAARSQRQGLACFQQLRAGWGASVAGCISALLWIEEGELAKAVALYARSELLRESVGAVPLPIVGRWMAERRESLRSALGTERFDDIWSRAQDLSPAKVPEIIAESLDEFIASAPESTHADGRSRVQTEVVVMRREGDVWLLAVEGVNVHLSHIVGLGHLAELLVRPNQDIAALALATAKGGASLHAPPRGLAPSEGDAGTILDERAIAEYRARLAELQDEIDESERWADTFRATSARAEMDALAHELAAAVGLGGRRRRSSPDAERARVNITKALRSAIAKVQAAAPRLGRHLERSITTGTFCAYRPDPTSPLEWRIEQT